MFQATNHDIAERILICAPFGRDAELIERELARAGLPPCRCSPLEELCRCIDDGAGAALISDHAFGRNDVAMLAKTLSGQPPWSALPILVITSGGVTTDQTRSVLRELEPLEKLTILERPLRPETLISSVRAAIRIRRQQYEIQDYVRRLQQSEITLQTYLDNTGNGICVLDKATGRILDVNKSAVELLGYSRDELLQLSISDIERGLTAAALSGFSQRQLRGVVEMEGANRRKDGSTFPVEVRLTSLAPALPAQVLAVMRDITERKRVELERAEDARRKDEFLALLGHELRNPLAAISTSLEVLSGNCTAAQRLQLRQAAVRQVGVMRRLLDDLLDLNRITHGQIVLIKESLDLAEFLEKAAAAVRSTIAERRQKLIVRYPSKPVLFMADRIRLSQIVANLLSNASKYTGPGGRIELSGAVKGSDIVVRCKDNGQGILPESTARIFEPFTRGPNARDSYGEASLGIGLALVKQLVELHGGSISVVSGGAGSGSQFTLRLPLVAPQPLQADVSEPTSKAGSEQSWSIAIVEDNPIVATSMKMALEQAGHRVRVFSDGRRALEGIRAFKPEAIVLDIGLPGMDGHELAAKLRSNRKLKNALFIAVSGFEQNRAVEGKGNQLFDHYFIKPVELSTLLTLFSNNCRNAAKGEAIKKAPKPKQTKRPHRPRVLLVEDHPFAADATTSLLRLEGLDVRTALTGREALEVAPKFQPQLILCDMRLGDMNGLEVIRELRSNLPATRTRAVILTGFSGSEIREINRRADEFGVDEFISKPLEPTTIRKLAAKLEHP